MTAGVDQGVSVFTWPDPLDAPAGWSDIERVRMDLQPQLVYSDLPDQETWYLELATKPPLPTERKPGLVIAYGLVLDTTGDGVGDYSVGIDNEAQEGGDFHVWVTDLATGETDEQIGPPYGYPVEFSHPDEPGGPPGPVSMMFTFLGRSRPKDLDPDTVRFYTWASTTLDGDMIALDYAPDTGWITPEAP